MLIGHFIFTDLFIGVIIQNLEEAQEEESLIQELKRVALFDKKKEFILAKQEKEIQNLLRSQQLGKAKTIQDILQDMAGKMRHDDLVPMSHPTTNPTWLQVYLKKEKKETSL